MRKFTLYSAAGGNPLVLGDDAAGHLVSADLPESSGGVEEVERLRATHTTRIARGNITNTLSWTVERDHGSERAALNFVRDHAQAVFQACPGSVQDSGSGVDTRWYANAVVTARCVRHDGQSTLFSYTMRAGDISRTQPT